MIHKLIQVSLLPRSLGGVLLFLALVPCVAGAQLTGPRYINPQGLAKPTGYTHVVIAPDGRTVYIAGQIAVDSAGKVVGQGNFAAQAEQVFRNLQLALESVGGSIADLVKTTTFVTDMEHLARPELLIEIEGVAVLRSIVRQ